MRPRRRAGCRPHRPRWSPPAARRDRPWWRTCRCRRLWDLEASPPPPPPGIPGEDWRMAACTGDVVFDAAAIRRVIEGHTNEAGVRS